MRAHRGATALTHGPGKFSRSLIKCVRHFKVKEMTKISACQNGHSNQLSLYHVPHK